MTTDKGTTPGHPEFEPSGSLPVRPKIGTFEADSSNLEEAGALREMLGAVHLDKDTDAAALNELLAGLHADDTEDGGR